MGACSFIKSGEGTSPSSVFNALCEDAEYEYGCDSYNGTISTTSLRKVHTFSEYKETNKRQREIAALENEILDRCPKWQCECIDLGTVRYEKVTLEKRTLKPSTKKEYVIYSNGEKKGHFASKREAEKKAEEIAVKELSMVFVKCELAQPTVSEISTTTKVFRRKPKNMKNVREVHKYIFVGWAAE